MPEIWLRYGTTDVALDIKFENLLNHVSSNSSHLLSENEIKSTISGILLTDNSLIVALSGGNAVAKIITALVEVAKHKGYANITVAVISAPSSNLKTNIVGDESVSIYRIDSYVELQDALQKFRSTIFVSHTSYDPLFGFRGTPTTLLRNFMKREMNKAFTARQNNLPNPGVRSRPLEIALSACQSIHATSIELIANKSGIIGLSHGDITKAFNDAITKLLSTTVIESEIARSAIVSSSGEINLHSTLTDSLNTLWNSIHIVKKNGSVILLAENRGGVGEGALQMFIQGTLNIDELKQESVYTSGLEHLVYIKELRDKYNIGMLTTVPEYYLKTKLGLSSFTSIKDVLNTLLLKHGKYHKILVLSDADIILTKPKL